MITVATTVAGVTSVTNVAGMASVADVASVVGMTDVASVVGMTGVASVTGVAGVRVGSGRGRGAGLVTVRVRRWLTFAGCVAGGQRKPCRWMAVVVHGVTSSVESCGMSVGTWQPRVAADR